MTGEYTRGDSHGEGDDAFGGGVLTSDGKVIFVLCNSDYVGIYDTDIDTYSRVDSHCYTCWISCYEIRIT
jgi:hypothetical protein